MARHHPANERIKREYFTFLREANRMAESSVDQIAAAIALFEKSTGHRDFKKFHVNQAQKFKRQLREQINPETGKPLAVATIHSRLMALKAFVKWLADKPGYKSRIAYSDAEYFNDSANDERVAKAVRQKPAPTLEQIRLALDAMPAGTILERRDRAVVAFIILSAARDDAAASMSLRNIDLERRTVDHDARTVRTKRRKSFVSTFFPVGDDIENIVRRWIKELKDDQHFGPDDPLFPATELGFDANKHFAPIGLTRRHWSSATAIRKIFREAFERAGLPYFNPHSFRNTLTALGQQRCQSPEEYKAWSQNMGHEDVLTTFTSYGAVAASRQAEIMARLCHAKDDAEAGQIDQETRRVLEKLLKRTG
ncbi:MAG TPA: tyrosine-type recombinase/integrase [Devosiaceae bacterium]